MRNDTTPYRDRPMTTLEAAEYLSVTRRTMERWRSQRIGPRWVKPGGKCLYRRSDLDAWLEQAAVEPVAEHG
ncbi:helix-turn-helix domain-containing protein [Halorhodospira sp. 9621]|uniref:helix-turn-helix domain-containing protein n=1 Tax=Halorhodospira sp. 9621 TaxID=2899135 RepID=UPI001EE81DD3|nr:helix-turn-helix domain-containing protein [Halorhodospira sp. 9621]MCG5534180.1 helix-turn-helix domain-containing protein [Halorhodospira sp. 9621]